MISTWKGSRLGCMTPELERLLSISEAARRLELSAQRVRALADEGRIHYVMSPLGRLFDPDEVERFRRTRGPFGRYQAPVEKTAAAK